jgi:hypothetical protein
LRQLNPGMIDRVNQPAAGHRLKFVPSMEIWIMAA